MTESDTDSESIERIEAALRKIAAAAPNLRAPAAPPKLSAVAESLDRLIDLIRTELSSESSPE